MRRIPMLVLTAAAGFAAHAQTMDVPDAVRPPAGAQAAMTWTGTGQLTYECKPKPEGGGLHEWTFVGPDAKLADAKTTAAMGRYYAGPTWEAADGSRITGKQVAIAPARTGNIPFQLVKTDGGQGVFKDVAWIQRVNTNGGVAPAETCSAGNAGTKKTVPYSADYVFYRAG